MTYKIKVLPTIFAVLLAASASAAWDAGLPMMHELTVDGPVWSSVIAGDDLVVGSNSLDIWNGEQWTRVSGLNAYAFRALAVEPGGRNRVWVGAKGDFGFIENKGQGWKFTTLRALARNHDVGDIWAVASAGLAAWFVSDQEVFRLDGEKCEFWPLPCKPRLIPLCVGAEQWVYQSGAGIKRLGADGPQLVFADGDLPAKPIVWALDANRATAGASPPPSADAQEGMLIGGADGVYVRQVGGWTKLLDVSAAVAGKHPVSGVWLNAQNFAVGTYTGGIVMADRSGRVLNVIDHQNGLPDDHVQGLNVEHGKLWVSMKNGLAQLHQNVSVFDQRSGLRENPAVKVSQSGIITEKTSYRFEGARVLAEESMDTLVHDAQRFGDVTWVAGFGGVWRRDALWSQPYHSAGDVFSVLPLNEDKVLLIDGRTFKELVPSPHGDWADHAVGLVAPDAAATLLRDAEGNLWVSSLAAGVYRYEVYDRTDARLRLRLLQTFSADNGRTLLTLLNGQVCKLSNGGITVFDPKARIFQPIESLRGFSGLAGAPSNQGGGYWVVQRKDLPVPALIHIDRELNWEPVDVPGLETCGNILSVNLTEADGREIVWISGAKTLLRIEPADTSPAPPNVFATMTVANEAGRKISFRSPAALADAVFYQTRLEQNGEWTAPGRTIERSLTGFAPGGHTVEVRAVDRWGRFGLGVVNQWLVPRPAWQEWPALSGYGIGLFLIVALLLRWRTSRLKRHNLELDYLVQMRTAELGERSKELEMANSAKERFLETISHETRNPLNALRGMIKLLEQSAVPHELKDLTASVSACAAELSRAFEGVLDFTKLESGQLPVKRVPFDLLGLVEEVLALHRITAGQAECELKAIIREGAPFRYIGDPEKIRTILNNFVSNAVKYAPGKPITIEVRALPDEPDQSAGASTRERADVTLSVRDQGLGVPAAEQAFIFNKFVRGQKAKADRIPGTGLGLAACKMLAEQMGDFVGLDSPSIALETGRKISGATFYVKLWLRVDKQPELATESAVGPGVESGGSLNQRAPRLLIVEDHAYNQLVASRVSDQMGFKVMLASDGLDALEKLERAQFDVLFIDWEMPRMKGDELARRVRAFTWGQEAVLVTTTGHDSDDVKAACFAAGMDAFVVKPYDEIAIRTALADVLAQRQEAGRAPINWSLPAPQDSSAYRHSGTVTATESMLDPGVFDLISNGNAEAKATAMRDYLASLAEEMDALQRAFAAKDWKESSRRAHRLRSHAGLLKAQGLRVAAKNLQMEISGADRDRRGVLLAVLVTEATGLRQALERSPTLLETTTILRSSP